MRKLSHSNLMPGVRCLKTVSLMLIGLLAATGAMAQATAVSGKVTDPNGMPLTGVTVIIQGTNSGTATDHEGGYTLQVSDPASAVLEFQILGYARVQQPVNSRTVIDVSLDATAIDLDEVVVVGYGTVRKKDLTGAVGVINTASLEKEQLMTVAELLRNNVPGLSMGMPDNAEGHVDDMLIRGKTNFRTDANNAPLIVLDDVIYYGRMTDINPADVESIHVLKDGSSSSIYGAKAANGVIIITTKKGKQGKPMIRFDATVGMSLNSRLTPTYEGEEFIKFRQDAKHYTDNANTIPSYYYDPRNIRDNSELVTWMNGMTGDPMDIWLGRLGLSADQQKNYKAGKAVSWKDLSYDEIALRQDYTLSVSGKNGETSYYTSIGYTDNKTNVKGSGFRSVKARINLESKATSFLAYGVNAQFANQDRSFVPVGSTTYRNLSPYGEVYDEDGKYKYQPDNTFVVNPLLDHTYTDRFDNTSILSATAFLKVLLPFGFTIETRFSPYMSWNQYYQFRSSEHPAWGPTSEGPSTNNDVQRKNNNYYNYQWDNLLRWNKSFGKHTFDFTYLMNWEQRKGWRNAFKGTDLSPNDILGWHGMQWAQEIVSMKDSDNNAETYDDIRTSDAIMARLNYTYGSRYMFTASWRRDGDSTFGKLNPHANFFSAALAWTFTEEAFFPDNDWFTYGKLRLSYGENGNRDLPNNAAIMTVSPRKYIYVGADGTPQTVNAYYAGKMANYGLRWEKTGSYNVALDFSMFKDRLSGTIDLYKKITTDLVISRQLPDVIGYTSVYSNIGEVQNTGIEVSLTSRNFVKKNFRWDTSFSYSYNKNRINSLGLMDENGKELDDVTNKRFIGQSMHEIWDYEMLGVYQEKDAEEAARFGLRPGDIKLNKNDWETTTYSNDDKKFLGSKVPLHRLSMRNTFTLWENLTFSFNVYSYLGYYKVFNRAKNDEANHSTINQPKSPYWTPGNPLTNYGRIMSKAGTSSYEIWRKADFLKIDNISIGYDIPAKYLQPLRLQALSVNVTLKNGILMTRWPDMDPEGAVSPIFVYFGLNATF